MSGSKPYLDKSLDVLDTPITEVVRRSEVSVRLNNALVNAGNVPPLRTVREYLEAGPRAKDKFLTIPNLGRRSADELDGVIHAFVNNAPSHRSNSAVDHGPTLDVVRKALVGLFSEFRFPDVFLEGVISTRLGNALRANPELPRRLSGFLDEPEKICKKLRSAANVGKISINELLGIAKEVVAATLRNAGFSEEDISYALAVIFDNSIASDGALAHLLAAVTAANAISADDPPSTLSVHEIVADAMHELSDRDRSVLERRYGFLTGMTETLEEIALDYRVTRERIRQIEAQCLRRSGRSKMARRLRAAFEHEIADRLMAATDNRGFIRDNEKYQVLRKLPAAVRFAIDVLYDNQDKFLSKHTRRWHDGWILPPLAKEELQELLRQIKARLALICLPVAFSEFTVRMPEPGVSTAIQLGTDLSIVEGYLVAGRVGPRLLRTIRLHRCLVEAATVLEVGDLIARYHQSVPNDKRSSVRDAMIVMLMAPHLFLGIFDRHWYGLGRAAPFVQLPKGGDEPSEAGADDEVAPARPDDEGIRALLRQILLDEGPLRFVDLRERAVRRMRGRSPHSVGPILLTSGEFVRPLPGIYAVPEQVPAAAAILYDPPPFLLAEEQVRYLAEARYAGEPFGRYPMWTPQAEYALCRWAQATCNPLIYQSLLAVASIDLWPVPLNERQHWSALQRSHGRYCLAAQPRYPIRELWPPLDRVLAACIVAHENNGLSWITANRVLKRRLDAHVAPGLLALMVSLGALQAPIQWQMFHKAGPRLTAIIQTLSRCLHERGVLDWASDVAEELIRELATARRAKTSGWVDADVVEDLIKTAGHRTVVSLPTVGEADESASSFEDLLREVAESREAESAHQTMRAVLGNQN